jgi:hypothetical protein
MIYTSLRHGEVGVFVDTLMYTPKHMEGDRVVSEHVKLTHSRWVMYSNWGKLEIIAHYLRYSIIAEYVAQDSPIGRYIRKTRIEQSDYEKGCSHNTNMKLAIIRRKYNRIAIASDVPTPKPPKTLDEWRLMRGALKDSLNARISQYTTESIKVTVDIINMLTPYVKSRGGAITAAQYAKFTENLEWYIEKARPEHGCHDDWLKKFRLGKNYELPNSISLAD